MFTCYGVREVVRETRPERVREVARGRLRVNRLLWLLMFCSLKRGTPGTAIVRISNVGRKESKKGRKGGWMSGGGPEVGWAECVGEAG